MKRTAAPVVIAALAMACTCTQAAGRAGVPASGM